MTFLDLVQELDGESGELSMALAKLRLQRSRGLTCTEEEKDFVDELFAALRRKKAMPLKARGVRSAFGAALLLIVSGLLPLLTRVPGPLLLGAWISAFVGLGYAVFAAVSYSRRMAELNLRHKWVQEELDLGTSLDHPSLYQEL